MKVSLNWLRDYVEFDESARELSSRLTVTLTETEPVPSAAAGVDGLVVARVVTVDAHPEADKLKVCVVDWDGGASSVVCGAPNVAPGMLTVLARPGAILAGGLKIEARKLRGVRSDGMLVSYAELGLEESSAGIIELDERSRGKSVAELLGLDDEVIDVDVQSNRPDCMGVVGIAREVAAAVGSPLTLPEPSLTEGETPTSELVRVRIEDPAGCPRYMARVVRGVRVGPSPMWLQNRLRSVGVRSISNIVDATNYVMLEYGHPIHAFDYDTVEGPEIVIRRAESGERITTLDGVERGLTPDHLLICDASRPIGIAGTMGGEETEVSDSTRDLIIECAWFDPAVVRRGAKLLGLRTEASQRFERGIDPEAMDRIVERVCALIAETAGGEVARGSLDVGQQEAFVRTIEVDVERVNAMIGPGIDTAEIARRLEPLGFAVGEAGATVSVAVPTWRPDVQEEADLIEEVARARGYDTIEARLPYHSLSVSGGRERAAREDARNAMVRAGFREILTTAFMREESHERLGGAPGGRKPVRLTNPINREAPLMRTSLLPGILDVVRRNRNIGERDLRLFEIGKVYDEAGAPGEEWVVAGALSGTAVVPGWDTRPRNVDFFDAKGVVGALSEALKVDSLDAGCYDGPTYDEGASLRLLLGNEDVGAVGAVSDRVRDAWDLQDDVFVFEIRLEPLLAAWTGMGRYERPPRYPKSRRDVALVVSRGVRAGDVVAAIEGVSEPLLSGTEIFDVYEGKQLPEDKKSIGIALTYMSRERTLTDEEVDAAHARIVKMLTEGFEATLRG